MESARTANVLPDVATIPVLLKLHGDLKAPQQWLLRSYIKHLPAGSLHVAYHVNEPQSASQQLAVSMLEGSGVHVCTFTTKAVETVFKAFFSKARKRADELGWKTFYVPNNYPDWPNLHSMVLPTVVNWWRQLGDRRLQFKHVWVVEGDALFVGSGVAGFFESFRSDQRDLLSTGFHLAGPGWWAYPLQTFGRTLTARRSNLTRFGLELGKGRPPAWAANWRARESGLLFRLTPVERYSSRLLAFAEDSLLRRGEGMHSEAFASSLCADASSWCTLGDWANSPTGQSNSFRSKFYSPFRGMDPADVVYARWCSDVCQRRCCDRTWIHPAMMLKAYPRPSNPGSAPSSGHVARVRAAHARLWAMYGQIPWGADANSTDALCSQCQHVPNKTWATREATSSLARPRARQRRRRP